MAGSSRPMPGSWSSSHPGGYSGWLNSLSVQYPLSTATWLLSSWLIHFSWWTYRSSWHTGVGFTPLTLLRHSLREGNYSCVCVCVCSSALTANESALQAGRNETNSQLYWLQRTCDLSHGKQVKWESKLPLQIHRARVNALVQPWQRARAAGSLAGRWAAVVWRACNLLATGRLCGLEGVMVRVSGRCIWFRASQTFCRVGQKRYFFNTGWLTQL